MKYILLLLLLLTATTSFAQVSSSSTDTLKPKQKPLMFVDEMPQFPGGQEALMNFLQQNIRYPAAARDGNIQGKVILQFVVNSDGTVTDIKTLRGVEGGCTEEALRVIKLMPKWTPGRSMGKAVPVYFNLPISFNLNNDDEPKKSAPDIAKPREEYGTMEQPGTPGVQPMLKDTPAPKPYLFVEQMPQFPGGQDAMVSFMQQNIRYPEKARQANIQGTVMLNFVVNTDGTVTDVKTLRGVEGGCTEEAQRVVRLMHWIPGKQNGITVPVYFNIPVSFHLEDDNDKKKK